MSRGCNTGRTIYPVTTNQFDIEYNPDVERFTNLNPINIRTWDNDPTCGLRDNKFIRLNKRCFIDGHGYGAGIVEFSYSDVTVCNAPIDTDMGMLLMFTVLCSTTIYKQRIKKLIKLVYEQHSR